MKFYVGDLVVNTSDRSVIGEVLPTSTTTNGLHLSTELSSHTPDGPKFTDSSLVPVRWAGDSEAAYEWWERPEFLEVVRHDPAHTQTAIH